MTSQTRLLSKLSTEKRSIVADAFNLTQLVQICLPIVLDFLTLLVASTQPALHAQTAWLLHVYK